MFRENVVVMVPHQDFPRASWMRAPRTGSWSPQHRFLVQSGHHSPPSRFSLSGMPGILYRQSGTMSRPQSMARTLRLFSNVKTLRGCFRLIICSRFLQLDDGEWPMELYTELEQLAYHAPRGVATHFISLCRCPP